MIWSMFEDTILKVHLHDIEFDSLIVFGEGCGCIELCPDLGIKEISVNQACFVVSISCEMLKLTQARTRAHTETHT